MQCPCWKATVFENAESGGNDGQEKFKLTSRAFHAYNATILQLSLVITLYLSAGRDGRRNRGAATSLEKHEHLGGYAVIQFEQRRVWSLLLSLGYGETRGR